jgi:threonine synthase
VQADGCAPIPRAFDEGKESADEWQNPITVAAGLRVPGAIGDFLMLRAIRETGGTAVAVSDGELMCDTRELASREGIFSSPEGGASLACLRKLLESGFAKPSDRIVVFITGSGYKYLDVLEQYV